MVHQELGDAVTLGKQIGAVKFHGPPGGDLPADHPGRGPGLIFDQACMETALRYPVDDIPRRPEGFRIQEFRIQGHGQGAGMADVGRIRAGFRA